MRPIRFGIATASGRKGIGRPARRRKRSRAIGVTGARAIGSVIRRPALVQRHRRRLALLAHGGRPHPMQPMIYVVERGGHVHSDAGHTRGDAFDVERTSPAPVERERRDDYTLA
jgi:hypothetical protein